MVASLTAIALAGAAVGVRLSVEASDQPSASKPASTVPASDWDPRLLPIVHFVEETRGKPFERPVPVRFLADEDFVAELEVVPLPPDEAELAEATERALGWIGAEVDSEAAWIAAEKEGVAAFFDPARRRIVLRGEDAGELSVVQRVILAHELTHAWQHQHVGLNGIPIDAEQDLAWASVVEGDATYVEERYLASLSDAEQRQWRSAENELRAEYLDRSGAPALFDLAGSAPYLLGERLVAALQATGGSEAVDLALDEPPSSSEQAMFAAVLDGGVGAHDVPTARWPQHRLVDERDVGAWDVFTTLVARVDGRTAALAARAWAGGTEGRYQERRGSEVCVTWGLAADDPVAEQRLTLAFRSWIAAGPAGSATLLDNADGVVNLRMCDPGAEAVSPSLAKVRDGVAWLLVHEDVVAALAEDVPMPVADCAATRLLLELDGEAVTDSVLTDRGPASFVARARGYADGCSARTVVGG